MNLLEARDKFDEKCSSLLNISNTILCKKDNLFFVDVGAYQGDFIATLLESFPNSKAILFEPTPESYQILKAKFKNNELIQIFNYALSNKEKIQDFRIRVGKISMARLFAKIFNISF